MANKKEIINNLIKEGYKESRNKADLFYKKKDEGLYFADLRGTEIVEINEDCAEPLFYANLDFNLSKKEKRSFFGAEYNHLLEIGCQPRLTFYFYKHEYFDDVSTGIDDEGVLTWIEND